MEIEIDFITFLFVKCFLQRLETTQISGVTLLGDFRRDIMLVFSFKKIHKK